MNPFSSSLSTPSSSKRKRDHNSDDEPSSSSKRAKHDLFVNYLYEDIGKSFISHVLGALHRNGFTISDHTKLVPVGQEVSCSEVLKAIEESEICVLVFSPKYASSERCLDELAHIMDCRDKFDQKKVFPVFFNVDPRDVRKQEGPFKEPFEAHTLNFDRHRVQKWRKALNDAGQLSGEHYNNGDDEESFICKIVKKLQSMQNPQELYVTDHAVGIESRVDELIWRLRLDLKDVSMIVAVWGIGGIGKTTIVKALYNKIAAEFDASCFLEVIPNYDRRSLTSEVEMQKLLISSLLKKFQYDDNNLPMIHHHSQGITMIRRLTRGRKLLLVLDDVTHVNQLEAFGIDPFKTSLLNTCFGGGSRIIVTTRDKRTLGRLSYVSYDTPLLNETESIELLTWLMYEQDDHPIKDMKFLEKIAWCAAGLPLVLEVWSLHFRHYEREQWPDVLKRLKAIPHDDVHKKLKISYDSLTTRAKKLFLDIACFFVKKYLKRELIVKVLEDEESGIFPDLEIQCLADRGLVNFSYEYGFTRVSMHDAIREMGEEIVRQENEDEPGQRTRLMKHKDVRRVLKKCSGTRSVQSICCKNRKSRMTVNIEAFRKMKNLRLIRLSSVGLRYGPMNLLGCDSDEGMPPPPPPLSFPKLKYLQWMYFPMESIDIDMCNVVVVELVWSCLKTLREGSSSKPMKKLKILDVNHSPLLTKTGSFIGLENLESLIFKYCERLEELDSSVCCLDKLVSLDLHECKRLKRFPFETIGKLRSLEVLDLGGCDGIGFEDDEVIKAFMSSLKETHITTLTLTSCNICKVPSDLGSLTWLKHLDLGGNNFHSLPDHSLIKLDRLKTLCLPCCRSLQSIPDLPPSVYWVKASGCESLTTLPSNLSELTSLRALDLDGCKFLTSLPSGMSELTSLEKLDLNGCERLTSLPSNLSELTCLKVLYLNGCFRLGTEEDRAECVTKLTGLTSLSVLEMGNCNVSQVPSEIGNLVSLRKLDLSGNPFTSLPDSFSNLLELRDLSIKDCSELTSLPLLPPFLKEIDARGCLALDVMGSAASVVIDNFNRCSIPPSRNRARYDPYEFSKCVLAAYKETSFHSRLEIHISADEVPNWCHYIVRQRRQGKYFMPPQLHLGMKMFGMILFCSKHYKFKLQNKTKGTTFHLKMSMPLTRYRMCVCFIPLDNTTLIVEAGDEFAILYVFEESYDKFSEYGLCLIYKSKGDEMEIEPTTNIHVNQVDDSNSQAEDSDSEVEVSDSEVEDSD